MSLRWFTVVVLLTAAGVAQAELLIADSGGDRIMLFDDQTGAVIDANWLTDVGAVGWFFTTPKEAMLVGNEIWVSDQVADAIHRFDLGRNFLGSVTAHPLGGTLDNLRGLGFDGTTVYQTVWPSTTTRRGIARYDTAGTPLGFHALNASLFDVTPFQGDLLISNETTDDIERWTTTGTFVGVFRDNVVYPQQIAVLADGSVLTVSSIAASGIEGVYHLNADGSLRAFIDTEPIEEMVPRSAYLLGSGAYLIGTSQGVYRAQFNGVGYDFTLVLGSVDAQYINYIPEPSTALLLALAGLAALRRKRA